MGGRSIFPFARRAAQAAADALELDDMGKHCAFWVVMTLQKPSRRNILSFENCEQEHVNTIVKDGEDVSSQTTELENLATKLRQT